MTDQEHTAIDRVAEMNSGRTGHKELHHCPECGEQDWLEPLYRNICPACFEGFHTVNPVMRSVQSATELQES